MEYMELHGNFNRAQSSAVALSLSLALGDQHTWMQPRDSRVLSSSCIERCCCMNSRCALIQKYFKSCSLSLADE